MLRVSVHVPRVQIDLHHSRSILTFSRARPRHAYGSKAKQCDWVYGIRIERISLRKSAIRGCHVYMRTVTAVPVLIEV